MTQEPDLKISKEDQIPREENKDLPKEKASRPAKEKMVKIKESQHQQLIKDASEYKDRYMRLYAEFENARKRMEREKLDFIKYANEGLLSEFLDIMDNLERSVCAAEEKHQDYAAFLKGIEIVMASIYEMLKKNGVRPIEAKGKVFDSHCHEALMQEENNEVEEGMVLEEFQKGYLLGERVVRTAKVKVSCKKSEQQ